MTRGQRVGQLTKEELTARLASPTLRESERTFTANKTKLVTLLGHAIYYKQVSELEILETTPAIEKTVACYLFSVVQDPTHRSKIEQYVKTASKLYSRGSIILNRCAQDVCGPRLKGASDTTVAVWRPRYEDASIPLEMAALAEELSASNLDQSPFKHAFLPERWPLSSPTSRSNARDARIVQSMARHDAPACPDWQAVMDPTGWDNVVNRMMSKFGGNIKVHAMANIERSIKRYLEAVQLTPVACNDDLPPRLPLIETVLQRQIGRAHV